jgi:hypothetical protein
MKKKMGQIFDPNDPGELLRVEICEHQPGGDVVRVQAQMPGFVRVYWVKESEIFWDPSPECDCGAKKVNAPGHSYWCSAKED